MKERATDRIDEFNKMVADSIGYMKTHCDSIDSMAGKAASEYFTKHYRDASEVERKEADKLRAYALIVMSVIALTLIGTLIQSTISSLDIPHAITRILVSLILTVPAAYLTRESTRHRNEYYTLAQTSLSLQAIDPYLASLPDEQRHKLKNDVAERIFIATQPSTQKTDSYPINIQSLLEKIIEKAPTQNQSRQQAEDKKIRLN